MFRELRRSEQKLPDEKAAEILEKGEYGVLSTGGEDGQPYGVPLNYVFMDGNLYFHGAREGQKLDHIRANHRVCFTVVGKAQVLPAQFTTSYESVVAMGEAFTVEGEEKRKALWQFFEKYSSEYMQNGAAYLDKAADRTAVVKIKILHLCGKFGH